MASTANLEGQSLTEIADYHNDVVDSLKFFLNPIVHQDSPRFIGCTLAEFNDLLLGRIEETELRSSLAVLAAVEAALRIDYLLRATKRYKDPLSKAFRNIYREKGENARFDDDLLELWGKCYPEFRRLIGELRAALHFRHWLAHGRYWERPTHGRFDYVSVYTLADILLTNFPLYRN
jgi:hypothetical protein